jgi:HK97 family phage major capsid protein
MEEFLRQLISRRNAAYDERAAEFSRRQAVLDVAKEAGRDPTSQLNTDEQRMFDEHSGNIRKLDSEIGTLDERIKDQQDEIERAGKNNANVQAVKKAQRGLESMNEEKVYRKMGPNSYMRDMVKVSIGQDYDGTCAERLRRHAQDVATLPEYQEARDLSRTDGQGGYAVPPAWLMADYLELARPGRAFANLVQNQPLPAGTDSINIPRLATGTATGVQTADNTNVVEQDLTDATINAPVRTIAGQQDLAIQLIDQSAIPFDQIVFRDLVADYAAQVDGQTLAGTGLSGQVLGVHGTAGIGTVAATAVTTQGVYSAVANAIQKIHTGRFMPPTVIVMHPRRWAWFLTLLDANQRPLFLPQANGPQNVMGVVSAVASEQVVGMMHGLPVVTDPNIATTYGNQSGGGTEDIIIVARASDLILWESGIRTRVLQETLSGQLTVRLQVFGYLAFSAARYPKSIVEVTGLTPPTF